MSEETEKDQKTEAPTEKRKHDASQKGDVLQSRELGTALVIVAGAAWLALSGQLLVGSLGEMLADGLTFDSADVRGFDPATAFLRMLIAVGLPLLALFGLTLAAAIGAPALLGSLGFRTSALGFKASKLNPGAGLKRMFGMNGLIELVKSIAKVVLLGAIGVWLLLDQSRALVGLSASDLVPALASIGETFVLAILIMALALVGIALIDVPAQFIQRQARLRMSKQEVKDEHKQTEGSPELKAAIRRKQHEVFRSSARGAVADATVVLTNPTHFAVALRYRPGEDLAPIVVARGRGATAEAVRELAKEASVPILSYPQLARAIYYTTRTGQIVREDLYMAVATVLAFVFNLNEQVGAALRQPDVVIPAAARFDEKGRPEG
jgi:flagellar biosynthesis protein FlhB